MITGEMNENDDSDCLIMKHSPLYDFMESENMVNFLESDNLYTKSNPSTADGLDGDGMKGSNEIPMDSTLRGKPKGVAHKHPLQKYVFDYLDLSDRENLDIYYAYRTMEITVKSGLLEEDDVTQLEAFKSIFTSDMTKAIRLYPHGLRLVGCFGVLIAYLIMRLCCIHYDDFAVYADYMKHAHYSDFILVIVTLIHGTHFYLFASRQSLHRMNMECLRKFLKLNSDLDKEVKKALAFVREREVLRQGYTMVSKFRSAPGIEKFPEGQVPDRNLRQLLFDCAKELFLRFKEETCFIMKSNSFDVTLFASPNLLALVDVDNYGVLFTDDFSGSEERLGLPALKAMCQLFSLQRSEFVTFLSLALSPTLYDEAARYEKYNILVKRVPNTLWEMTTNAAKFFKKFQHAMMAYTAMLEAKGASDDAEDDEESRITSSATSNRVRNNLTTPDLQTAMHSLVLHLQLALETARDVKTRHEKQVKVDQNGIDWEATTSSDGGTPKNLATIPEQDLIMLEAQLHACTTCIEELHLRSQAKHPEDTLFPDILPPPPNNSSSENVKIIDDQYNPEIKFQVFEGTAVERDSTENNGGGDFDPVTIKTQRQRAKSLVSELKSVLTNRSREMFERECRAIAEQRGVPLDEVTAELEADREKSVSEITTEKPVASQNGSSTMEGSLKSAGVRFEDDFETPGFGFMPELAKLIAKKSETFRTDQTSEQFIGDGDQTDSE